MSATSSIPMGPRRACASGPPRGPAARDIRPEHPFTKWSVRLRLLGEPFAGLPGHTTTDTGTSA